MRRQPAPPAGSDLGYVTQIGAEGTGNDQFSFPIAVATDGTSLWVTDTGNGRIVRRNASDLAYVSQVGSQGNGPDQFVNPGGVAVSGSVILVADSYNHRIVKRGAQ